MIGDDNSTSAWIGREQTCQAILRMIEWCTADRVLYPEIVSRCRRGGLLSANVTDLGMISLAIVLTVKSRIWLSVHCIDGC